MPALVLVTAPDATFLGQLLLRTTPRMVVIDPNSDYAGPPSWTGRPAAWRTPSAGR